MDVDIVVDAVSRAWEVEVLGLWECWWMEAVLSKHCVCIFLSGSGPIQTLQMH